MNKYGLQSCFPPGTITWEAKNNSSTIDLIFTDRSLTETIICYIINPTLDQSSDHILIITELMLACSSAPRPPKKLWKNANVQKIKAFLKGSIPVSPDLGTPEEIDETMRNIIASIQEIMNKLMPDVRPTIYTRPGWTKECSHAVKKTKKLRRI